MDRDKLFTLLDEFKVETPSWGFADTGTRFGKFLQPAAASTIEEKLQDAGIVHKYTGACPTVAVHVLWDYKPFEPAFYHTDIADWGMALVYAKKAGPRAKVLVDTGHHLPATNIEQIVAWLLDEEMLGGFHFNDRKYADDDLTLGSIDPYAVFRIFHEIRNAAEIHGKDVSKVAYMVDQSHNLKPKVE